MADGIATFITSDTYCGRAGALGHHRRSLESVVDYLPGERACAPNGPRLDLPLGLVREWFYLEGGADIRPWLLVHGQRSPKDFDKKRCNIIDQSLILLRHDCRSDFTFPAARTHVDPRIEVT